MSECRCENINHHCKLIPRLIGKWKCGNGDHAWRMHYWAADKFSERKPMQERCDRCGTWGYKPGDEACKFLIDALLRSFD